ncbi:hypothetical protein A4A49_16888 [Nicotiana attenuata]|uniref:Uncharacterized protein n=1 Tax=Nicotiana attenuata TaxID=49451 RepID=A0A1J6IGJ8_NICAT|nr:hypothetical protein A4A49_16888 [Nicotiana attenuata]
MLVALGALNPNLLELTRLFQFAPSGNRLRMVSFIYVLLLDFPLLTCDATRSIDIMSSHNTNLRDPSYHPPNF